MFGKDREDTDLNECSCCIEVITQGTGVNLSFAATRDLFSRSSRQEQDCFLSVFSRNQAVPACV